MTIFYELKCFSLVNKRQRNGITSKRTVILKCFFSLGRGLKLIIVLKPNKEAKMKYARSTS